MSNATIRRREASTLKAEEIRLLRDRDESIVTRRLSRDLRVDVVVAVLIVVVIVALVLSNNDT